jgi:hypothetical protein
LPVDQHICNGHASSVGKSVALQNWDFKAEEENASSCRASEILRLLGRVSADGLNKQTEGGKTASLKDTVDVATLISSEN